MLQGDDLRLALQSIAGMERAGVWYRAIHLEALFGFHQPRPYPAAQPLYSLGAPVHGARFTPRGGPPSLYIAEEVETAIAEANPIARSTGCGLNALNEPTVVLAVEARLLSVIDLTSALAQARLDTELAELLGPWRRPPAVLPAPTQILGQFIYDSRRFDGVRYPSSRRSEGHGMVVFTDLLVPPAFLEVHDRHRNVHQRLP